MLALQLVLLSLLSTAEASIFDEPSLARASSICTIKRFSNLKNKLPSSTHGAQNIVIEDVSMEECHRQARSVVGKKFTFHRGINGLLGKENRLVTEARYTYDGVKFSMQGTVNLK